MSVHPSSNGVMSLRKLRELKRQERWRSQDDGATAPLFYVKVQSGSLEGEQPVPILQADRPRNCPTLRAYLHRQ
jgi:hypothetical protein